MSGFEIVRWPIEDLIHVGTMLDFQREIALHGGEIVSSEAWREIDRLLDMRNAIVALRIGQLASSKAVGGNNA